MIPSLNGQELMAWVEKTWAGWYKLISTHPEVLALPCDIAGVTTAAALLQHMVAVELRYAERLCELPATEYAAIAFDSIETIYATHARAAALFEEQLASEVDWNGRIEFATRSMGSIRSSRRTVLLHALLHSVRHFAQLATLVRRHGFKPDWPMDYMFMDAERV